ncbi:respiratory nitrate reductase subunit gamma [Bacillus sp. PS06]|uniref:respiratory nitrate reductase subunit gamma n=1 Tax=Bacillus sp. PS06 TaxID=2764176 RepID=UPI001781367E|nr:respiratory nitrate reductase subunit gamma [Bacillus sp. PS06]MBD8070573.1 respiratory nitrate reductase subunit gamma [Bacillus sp. PS06]
MDMLQGLLWIALPYSSIAILVMGLIWQYESQENYGDNKQVVCWKNACVSLLVIVALGTGVYSSFVLQTQLHAFEWLFNLVTLNPSLSLIEATPFLFKLHLLSLCSLFIFLPFTKYIKLLNSFFMNKRVDALPFIFLLFNL